MLAKVGKEKYRSYSHTSLGWMILSRILTILIFLNLVSCSLKLQGSSEPQPVLVETAVASSTQPQLEPTTTPTATTLPASSTPMATEETAPHELRSRPQLWVNKLHQLNPFPTILDKAMPPAVIQTASRRASRPTAVSSFSLLGLPISSPMIRMSVLAVGLL